jgi:hypothetical protein
MPGASRRFRRSWTAFVLLLTVAPYFLNRLTTPKAETYAWIVPPYPADSYAYRAWAQQAFDGSLLFTLKHTAIPQKPFLFLPFFLAAGLLARVSRLDIGLVFLLLKSVGVLVFFHAFFDFARRLKMSSFQSSAAAVFAGVGAGFGAFAPLVFHPALPIAWAPLDAWLVDANTFWSLLWNPLFPFSLALILLSLRLADKSLEEADAGAAWRGGLGLGALALIHPYPLVVLYPLITVLCVVGRPRGWLPYWLRLIGASAPAALYVAAVSYFQPLIRTHNAHGSQDEFVLFAYLSGFGLPLILAATGLALEGAAFAKKYWLLLAWLGLSLALCQSPFWFRTKYVFGTHLAVCLLAGAAAETLFRRLPWGRRVNVALAAVFVAASCATTVLYLTDSVTEVSQNADGEYRLSAGFLAGVDYLRAHAARSDVVFSDPWTSAKICAYAGNTVVWGHWAQGVDSGERQKWVEAVFSPASGLTLDQRRRLFWNSGVEYVFVRGLWREGIASGVGAELLRGADKVFENDAVAIYRRKS